MHPFAQALTRWYAQNKRELPWRKTNDPYKIWIAEIILQQTTVSQGISYYERFLEKYGNVAALASAPVDDVLKTWQGLGYYSRARNLHHAACQVMETRGGKLPANYDEWLKLKGVGEFTAADLCALAFGECRPAIDGNGYRVLSRCHGIDTPINTTSGKKEFAALAQELITGCNPADFNQGLMDMGALQCVPRNPDCPLCPLATQCVAYADGRQASLPVKKKQNKPKERFFTYLMVEKEGKTIVHKRTSNGIWQGLYEPILIESDTPALHQAVTGNEIFKQATHRFGRLTITAKSNTLKHQLTHQTIYAQLFCATAEKMEQTEKDEKIIEKNELEKYAVPKLVEKLLNKM